MDMETPAIMSPSPDDDAQCDFYKYHGLGNDYLVMEPGQFKETITPAMVEAICDRNLGVGGDGVLWGPLEMGGKPGESAGSSESAGISPAFGVRIFNPDGSEAEKSGNGLRIFARHLLERGFVTPPQFSIAAKGGVVVARTLTPDGRRISMNMGRVRFDSEVIPMTGPPREVLRETLRVLDSGDGAEKFPMEFTINGANVGNPHCVVLVEEPTPALARRVGPLIERHPSFPNRTNVQFMSAVDPHAIRIEIWERGAGYTRASGTSSCAAAAVACRLGTCESPVTVHMPGGSLEIRIDSGFNVEMEGDVEAVARGTFSDEFMTRVGLTRA